MGQVIDATGLFKERRDRRELALEFGRAVGAASVRAVEIAGDVIVFTYRACVSLTVTGLLVFWPFL